jgi:exoribonuclease-2
VERPGEPSPGHFGLAVQDYTHSTAPNRRFADVVTQRLLKSVVGHQKSPYSDDELSAIATNCTTREDAARKVERGMTKRVAAVSMSSRLGQIFDGIVTGASPKGTFVRVLAPHVEGMLMHAQGVDVGDRLRVKLVNADPHRGFIDFVKA